MPATSPTTAERLRARLAKGVPAETIASVALVTVQAVNDCLEGKGAQEANRRIHAYLSVGAVPHVRDDKLAQAGDRLCQAISHAFVHLPERVDGHTHVLGSADLCCRMTSEVDLAADRDRVQKAIMVWHIARRAAS